MKSTCLKPISKMKETSSDSNNVENQRSKMTNPSTLVQRRIIKNWRERSKIDSNIWILSTILLSSSRCHFRASQVFLSWCKWESFQLKIIKMLLMNNQKLTNQTSFKYKRMRNRWNLNTVYTFKNIMHSSLQKPKSHIKNCASWRIASTFRIH